MVSNNNFPDFISEGIENIVVATPTPVVPTPIEVILVVAILTVLPNWKSSLPKIVCLVSYEIKLQLHNYYLFRQKE